MKVFRRRPQKEWKNISRIASRTGWPETKKLTIQLTTTRNNNKQQQDVKSNAEL